MSAMIFPPFLVDSKNSCGNSSYQLVVSIFENSKNFPFLSCSLRMGNTKISFLFSKIRTRESYSLVAEERISVSGISNFKEHNTLNNEQ